jgi:hypothetical protein
MRDQSSVGQELAAICGSPNSRVTRGPFDNRRDLEPIDSKEPDPHAAFAKIVFEVYYH